MATAVTFHSGPSKSKHKIFNIVQQEMEISQELKNVLNCAAEAFLAKSYKTAVKHFKIALNLWKAVHCNEKDEKCQNHTTILIKYMLSVSWLESTEAKDLLDALRNLEELERSYGFEYPMLYYAVGKAYLKLFRFSNADGILKKGFAILRGNINVVEYSIPGTSIVIFESSRERLMAALVSLAEQCSGWHPPDAVCCMPDCLSYSHNESPDKNIFFRSPTFNGMVQVSCSNTSNFCIMSFHSACWKAKKEQLCSLGKISDKDILNWECFTPNCSSQGARHTIKKIEIFDEHAEVKALIEPRADDNVWHAKPNPPSKGAIRKKQHIPRVKVSSNEHRAAPCERPARPQPVPNNVVTHNNSSMHRTKIEESCEEDDAHDEQALKASIEKLIELRANNFGIKDDAIWRPDLQMYGNEYMLATADLIPDPDFKDDGNGEADLKAFFFSYFYSFISENGPVKIDILAEKWNEAKSITPNCDAVLKHYYDITEFLLQSVKFAVVNDYICVPEKLPEAYDLAKNDSCEILRFFMDNDIDQSSNNSSIDDEAVFNDIINQERNNNSLPHFSVPGDANIITNESSGVSDEKTDMDEKEDEKSISEPEDTQDTAHSAPLIYENDQITNLEVIEAETLEEKELNVPSQFDVKYVKEEIQSENAAATNMKKECEKPNKSSTIMINGFHKLGEIKKTAPLQTNYGITEITKPIETKSNLSLVAETLTNESKSVSELSVSVASVTDNHSVSTSHSSEPANLSLKATENRFLSTPTRENGIKKPENTSKSLINSECKQDTNFVKEFIDEMQKLSTQLAEYKKKTQHLESELEHVKKAHAAMRVRMFQKSLHGQYAYDHSIIMMKIEECHKNYNLCTGIQSMLMNSIGQNSPENGREWLKVKSELEEISKDHENKFWEINDQLYTKKLPENLKEVNLELEAMPDMPQLKLMDVIQAAFGTYRMHLMKEFQQLQVLIPPPAQTQMINHPQPQSMFIGTQYRPPTADYYVGPHIYAGNPALAYRAIQPNFINSHVPQNVSIPAQPNPADTAPLNYKSIQNIPPPVQNFPNFSQQLPMYQTMNSHVRQTSPSTQQPVFTTALPTASKQTVSWPHQNTSLVRQSAPTPNISVSEPSKITTPMPLSNFSTPEQPNVAPLIKPVMCFTPPPMQHLSPSPQLRSLSSVTQQNGQSSVQSVLPRRPNTVAEIENQQTPKQSSVNLSPKRLKSVTSEFPMFIPPQEFSTPMKIKSSFMTREQNVEPSTTTNAQRANSVPEIPMILKTQERAMTPMQKKTSACEHKEVKTGEDQYLVQKNSVTTNIQQNWNMQATMPLRSILNENTHETINARVTEDSLNYDRCASSGNSLKIVELPNNESAAVDSSNTAPEPTKKSEHSMDKLMRKMREQYNGVLDLDLLKAVEYVRKKHNNSLSRLSIKRIIREANKFIVDRQQKQLCGYVKRPSNHYVAVSNSAPWCLPDDKRKQQTSVSSTSSASSVKKDTHHSSTSKKQWEPVVTSNDTWERETPESDCVICLETMLNNTQYTLQCKHTFHKKCIKNWYQNSQSCPTCRVYSKIDDEYPPLPLG